VSWRVIASGPPPVVRLNAPEIPPATTASKGQRSAYFPEWEEHRPVPVYDRYLLAPGATLEGPAIIEERESTIVIGPEARIEIDSARNVSVWL
jgi:N-methylhydantoinase A